MCVLYDLVVGKLNNVVVGWLVAYYQAQGMVLLYLDEPFPSEAYLEELQLKVLEYQPQSCQPQYCQLQYYCKWGSGLLKSRLCFLTSKNHKQDYKQRGTTTWG